MEKRFKLCFDEQVSINNSHLKTSEILTYMRNSRLYFSGMNLNGQFMQVQIIDVLGQRIIDERVSHPENGIKLSLSSGYYWAIVLKDGKQFVSKFYYSSGNIK